MRPSPKLAILLPLLLLLTTACTTTSKRDAAERRAAPVLDFGVRTQDTLGCPTAGCAMLYRLNITRPLTISIEVAPLSGASASDYTVALLSHDLAPHTESRLGSRAAQSITKHLEAGLYYVRVRNLFARNEPLRFEIRATVGNRATPLSIAPSTDQDAPTSKASPSIVEGPKPRSPERTTRTTERPTPPPRQPRIRQTLRANQPKVVSPVVSSVVYPVLLRSDVIEIEREAGRPIAVLIDAGTATGIYRGASGRLVDEAREIAEIEITDIYGGGSRARIVGDLRGDITTATVVEVYSSESSR